MKQLSELEFIMSERGKFTPQKNMGILFPYLVERVEQEGVVDLGPIARELANRFDRSQCTIVSALYSTAELVSSQFRLQTIRFEDAIKKCYPDVDETRGFGSCRVSVLLYREEATLLKYIKSITIKRNVVRVESREGVEDAS